MAKLIHMDLYRMLKSKSFLLCLLLSFVLAVSGTPVSRLLFTLTTSLAGDTTTLFPAEALFSSMLSEPFPLLGLLLLMLSLCYFFYADVENGYIKNIAGQMPMKGFTVLSKFIVAVVHNLFFVALNIIGNLIGTVFIQRIVMDAQVLDSLRVLALKLLLVQSLCALLLLAVTTLRSKSLGMVLAVLFGLGLTPLIYMGINEGLKPLFGQETDISRFMPDTVMNEEPLDTLKALAVAIVAGAVFLIPAIRIFDLKDVK